MTAEDVLEVREDARKWFQGWGRVKEEETNTVIRAGRCNVIQRRITAYKKWCMERNKPCRIVAVKYRRARCSTISCACLYTDALNHRFRMGVIGTDYKAAGNMLEMIKTFGKNDDFPGWSDIKFEETIEKVAWEDRVTKDIATRIEWGHGSRIDLYTAENPESARSAGLQSYLATEVGRWPKGGVQDGKQTLMSMRNTLPRRGYHLAIEEGTADGAQGVLYETAKGAKWPENDSWWHKWRTDWPLEQDTIGSDLQFTLIFAGWFEDENNFLKLTPEQEKHIQNTLDAEEWYDGEKNLIELYQTDGPNGKRLGDECEATVWQQLAWRRMIIKQTGGLEAFKQEFPSSPSEAFRASGSPVFSQEGLAAIEVSQRSVLPERGIVDKQLTGGLIWVRTKANESVFERWEEPMEGARYIVSVDPASGAEIDKTTRVRDCHSVLVLRDSYQNERAELFRPKLVARIKAPCRWEVTPLCRQIALLSEHYGKAITAVERNTYGIAVISKLREMGVLLTVQKTWDSTAQAFVERVGWQSGEDTRRLAVAELQRIVRETGTKDEQGRPIPGQGIDIPCPVVLGEMRQFCFNEKGRPEAVSGYHDDNVLSLAIGVTLLPFATTYQREVVEAYKPRDGYREV